MGTLRVGQAGGTAEEPRPPELWGVLVTYRRPDALKDFLDKLHNQTQRMAGVVVVDNGADDSAKEAAMAAGAEYIDAQGNTGPAGGIALGMEFVLGRAADHDWVVVFDDDDPPQDDDLLERVFWFALERLAVDENVGAVGTVGARYDRRTGIFRRVPDSELTGVVPVDYVGGGQFPHFRVSVLREIGVFDRTLFFGFDDAEFGLRLRANGYAILVPGELWKRNRAASGRMNLRGQSLRSKTPAWRRYYGVRNTIVIARRYGRPWAAVVVAVLGGARGFIDVVRARETGRAMWLPLLGVVDGISLRMGRRIDPQTPPH